MMSWNTITWSVPCINAAMALPEAMGPLQQEVRL